MDNNPTKPDVKIKVKKKAKLKLKAASEEPEITKGKKPAQETVDEVSPPKIKIKVKKEKKKRIKENIALDISDKEYNKKLRENEEQERKVLEEDPDFKSDLYPNLNDPAFSLKIAKKLEFSETKYKGDIANVEAMAEKMCNEERELAPHQVFVRNFLSFNTPYNSLLLYHGLGSGKTCAAVGIMEETRSYFKQLGIKNKIFVLAQPNVQNNFKTELFDARKLTQVNGIWKLKSCIGENLLKEFNANTSKLNKESIVKSIYNMMRNSYKFIGYEEFASYITGLSNIEGSFRVETKKLMVKKKLNNILQNTLIVIDEVHNIRPSGTNKQKRIYETLMILANYVENIRFLFLSATPMFNNSTEIVPLINVMNVNDNRSMINIKEVFDDAGNLKLDESTGETVGENLLVSKLNGYISYVRGENPYTYPYKIYPSLFESEKSIKEKEYPEKTLNGIDIIQPIQYIDLYTLESSSYQEKVYKYVIEQLKTSSVSFENLEAFGYTLLNPLIQILNIVYPNNNFNDDKKVRKELLYGIDGFKSVMTFTESKQNYNYKKGIVEKYGRIFSKEVIGEYSPKIKTIIDSIEESNGIILVYSNYLDSGLVPLALALEEFGMTRHGDVPSLFKPGVIKEKNHFKYVIISGEKKFSPNNKEDLKACTNESNFKGDDVKVILISRAGSEGLDFRNIRQVHILEPWYNMNRIDQTIGRAVRTKSHCQLPFIERNVMIYLYGTLLSNNTESTDLYIYRHAEQKAVQIGKINRLLKQNAVDCLLNKEQGNFTEEKLDQTYEILLSNFQKVEYKVGDKPFSDICDYMESCNFVCRKEKEIKEQDLIATTYSQDFSNFNNEKIIKKIKALFKEYYFLKKEDLIANLNLRNKTSLLQIYSALDKLLYDKNEFVYDRYGKTGHIINIGNYYLFQPIEIDNTNISLFERSVPIKVKRKTLTVDLPKKNEKSSRKTTNQDIADDPEHLDEDFQTYLESLKEKYVTATSYSGNIRSTSKWYEVVNTSIKKLSNFDISQEDFNDYIIHHIVDTIPYTNKIDLLNYLYTKDSLDDFEKKMKDYIDRYLFKTKNPAIVLLNNQSTSNKLIQKFFVFRNNKWNNALPEEIEMYSKEIKEIHDDINANLADIYGFITPFKKNDELVYKIKTRKTSGNVKAQRQVKGARCDQANKSDMILLITEILKEKNLLDVELNLSKIPSNVLCCIQELLLRHFNENDEKKIWFVNPERLAFIK
tara:strand:- start:15520 stop:19197 length:3678 start_codon:yes stop_codon:yes gene_type:complete